jgi:putative endonuclease
MFSFVFNRSKLLTDAKRLGCWGEKQGERFLRRKGLRTLTRNFNCKTGELDLVMADPEDGAVVFVEVKTRANEDFAPAESAVTFGKQKKMASAARFFTLKHKIENRPLRFDVVAIVLGPKGPPTIRHYQRAFVP